MKHGLDSLPTANLSVVFFMVGAAACAQRPPVAAPTAAYDCSDVAIVLRGDEIEVHDPDAGADSRVAEAYLERRDRDATLFTTLTVGDAFATEYVVPDDPRKNVIERVTDLRKARRLVRRDICVARGGYTDSFVRHLDSETLEPLRAHLSNLTSSIGNAVTSRPPRPRPARPSR